MPGSFVFAIRQYSPNNNFGYCAGFVQNREKGDFAKKNAQRLLMGCIVLRSQCGVAYGNGRGEIRTRVTIARESVFETAAFVKCAYGRMKKLFFGVVPM